MDKIYFNSFLFLIHLVVDKGQTSVFCCKIKIDLLAWHDVFKNALNHQRIHFYLSNFYNERFVNNSRQEPKTINCQSSCICENLLDKNNSSIYISAKTHCNVNMKGQRYFIKINISRFERLFT